MPRLPHSPALVSLVVLFALLLASCSGGSATSEAPLPAAAPTAVMLSEAAAPAADDSAVMRSDAVEAQAGAPAEAAAEAAPDSEAQAQPEATAIPPGVAVGADSARKVIKNAALIIEVGSVPNALSQISTAAATLGGYVLETRTDYSRQYARQAVLSLAVPVDHFESLLERVREAAAEVLSEQASGSDVSQEFVDVQSQISNLEATQARIRQFLDQATSVEESLRVNAQLSEIEGQLSQLKGRLQYLSQRVAYSTVTVDMRQTPEPTPEPTPTPLPAWDAGATASQAYSTLTVIVQAIATVAIWLAILVLPLALPALLLAWGIQAARRRKTPGAPPEP